MNDIETRVRGFQKKKKVPLTEIAEAIDRTRDHFYKLFSGAYVLSKEDEEKLNEWMKEEYNYD